MERIKQRAKEPGKIPGATHATKGFPGMGSTDGNPAGASCNGRCRHGTAGTNLCPADDPAGGIRIEKGGYRRGGPVIPAPYRASGDLFPTVKKASL